MWIKVCGITTLGAALATFRAGANAVGFVFYRHSRRYLPPDNAAALSSALPPAFARVGVFVDEAPEVLLHIARTVRLTHLQLHGSEAPELAAQLPLPFIKAIRLNSPEDLRLIGLYAGLPNCFGVLVEPYVPHYFGGAGLTLDPDMASQAREAAKAAGTRFILSGGLTPENVAAAVAALAPDGIDVSSGVEIAGHKDIARIFAFVTSARLQAFLLP